MTARTRTLAQAAVIVLAGAVIYAPVVSGGWLWDDATEIARNPALRLPGGWWRPWFAPAGQDYFPLTATVHWLQWHLWGVDTAGYHLTNIGLHLLSALLFWRLLVRLGLRHGWLGGLLFTIHPLAVESVAWMSELKNTLSLPPLLLSVAAFAAFEAKEAAGAKGRARASLAGAALWFLAAMLAKPSGVMLPVFLLVFLWWRRGRIGWTEARATIPFFIISAGLGAVTLAFQARRVIAHMILPSEGILERIAAAGLAVPFYLAKCLWPANLLPIYPRWPVSAEAAAPWLAWGALLGFLSWLATRRAPWSRHALLGLAWFLLHLAPVVGLLPMAYQRISRVGDHLAYVPLLGILGLIAAGWSAWEGRSARAPSAARSRLVSGSRLIGAVACLLLVWSSRAYAAVFRSEQRLWTYTLRRNPDAWLAHNNLGQIYLDQGRVDDALVQCRAAVRLKPGFPEVHNNLGLALARAGRLSEAVAQWTEALRLNPSLAGARFNLADGLIALDRVPEAIGEYERGLRLDPGNAAAWSDLGLALAREGRLDEAIARYREALRLEPDFAQAHNNLGTALARSGRLSEAIAEFKEALRLQPGNAGTHRNLAFALQAMGRNGEAAEHFAAAARLERGR
ncbi:MAG: tetratricopeptide repeat protein [Opitutaceae bacterium]